MLKFLGSLCILVGGAMFWLRQLQACRREVELLSDLAAALEELAEEIRMTQRPLPWLLERLQTGRSQTAAHFFAASAAAARSGESLTKAWTAAADDLPLDESVRRILQEAGHCLCGDEARVVQGLRQASGLLGQCREEKRRQRPERERRAAALSFSAAALLVILLI